MKKIIFIHIPKTAGATFRSILKKNYSTKESFFIHDLYPEISLNYLNKISNHEFNRFSLIAGHGTQYILPKAKSFKSIIFLRDPVDQIISSFYHIKRSPHSPLFNELTKVHSLHEYFNYIKENNGFNFQTFYLSRTIEDFNQKKRFKKINLDDFNNAMKILENIDYIFLTEYFNESLFMLKKDFGFRNIFYTYRNLSTNRSMQDEIREILQKFKAEQIWDYDLYKYAMQRFTHLENKYQGELTNEVIRFNKENKIYNYIFRPLSHMGHGLSYFFKYFGIHKTVWETKPKYD